MLTDADGRFELAGLVPRAQTLSARHEDYLDGYSEELALEDVPALLNLTTKVN